MAQRMTASAGRCRLMRGLRTTALSQTLPLRPPLPQNERAAEVGEPERASECLGMGHPVELVVCTLLLDTDRSADESRPLSPNGFVNCFWKSGHLILSWSQLPRGRP